MSVTLIHNIGTLIPGPADAAPIRDCSIVIEDGVITSIAGDHPSPDVVIDANGLDAIPGLIDGHVHPTAGEWTPAQDSIGWISNYVHGGTTSFVSAGELHFPGLAFEELTPRTIKSIAFTSRDVTARISPLGARIHAGTPLLVPGLTEDDFDEFAAAGIALVKFIFYDWDNLPSGEAAQYVEWSRTRGIVVKVHSGGVSRSGSSRLTGYDILKSLEPDVVAHISGGPIPMPDEEIPRVIDDLPGAAIEVCSSMNYRATKLAVEHMAENGCLDRLVLGTDTPGGTGVIPRGMLRNICYLASVCGISPTEAIAAGTANTARAHGIDGGILEVGAPGDLILAGPIRGSRASNVLECFALGDLPGISQVLIGGRPAFPGRSQQTPPPARLARLRGF